MKMIKNENFNIEYEKTNAKELQDMNFQQAKSIAIFIDGLLKRIGEQEFLITAYQNQWPVPTCAEIKSGWK